MDQKQYEYNADRVSVVTPVYNGEGHISKMLDSILAQTYPNIEMILVDDGSSDHTVSTAQGYCDLQQRGMDSVSYKQNTGMRPRQSTEGCLTCQGNI